MQHISENAGAGSKVAGECPRSAPRDARRLAILEIAREVFLAEGYSAASMAAIAARVGGSKATLYNHFPSKEELFTAVIQDHCARGQLAVFDIDPDEQDFSAALRKLGERYLRLMLSDNVLVLHRLVVAESMRFPEIGRILYAAGHGKGHARLAEFLRRAMAGESLPAGDADLAAEQLMDLCLSGLYRLRLWNIAPPPTDAQIVANVDAALSTFMAAFGAPEAA